MGSQRIEHNWRTNTVIFQLMGKRKNRKKSKKRNCLLSKLGISCTHHFRSHSVSESLVTFVIVVPSFIHARLCHPVDCSTPGLPVLHHLPKLTQTHVHSVSDAIQPFLLLSSPSAPTFNLSHRQGLFQWVSSLHQVAKELELQLQHQSFQWIFRTDFL